MVDYFEYSYRGNDVRVPFNDILYIETSGSSHKLRIIGKNFIKEFYGTISSVQEQDEKTKRFFSSHKSFLANIDNIRDYDKKTKEIVFYEGHRCPVYPHPQPVLCYSHQQSDVLGCGVRP